MTLLGSAVRELRAVTLFRLQKDFFGDWGTANTHTGEHVSQETAMTVKVYKIDRRIEYDGAGGDKL